MGHKSCCVFFSCLRKPSNSSSCNKNFSRVGRKALVGRELCLFVCFFLLVLVFWTDWVLTPHWCKRESAWVGCGGSNAAGMWST
jgi:hypothetical protein